MLTTAELTALAKQTAVLVREATAPLLKRIAELESRQPEKGEKGEPGRDGKDGAQGPRGDKGETGPAPEESVIKALIEAHVKSIALPQGPKGEQGERGLQGDRGEKGEAGEPGQDGRDAEVSFDDIVKAVETVHERLIAKYMLDFERRATDTLQKAIDKIPAPKDGKDGRDGKDGQSGKDGLSVTDLQREYDPATHEIVETWRAPGSEVAKSMRYPAGGIRPAGYWKERTVAKSGEAWTHEGTLWIAMRDTSEKPSIESKDWVIGARKGRDGVSKPVKL